MSSGKDTTIHLIVGFIKKTLTEVPWMQFHCIKMIQYFPKAFKSFGHNINVTVDLSNYATKTDLKDVKHVDTSTFALKKQI